MSESIPVERCFSAEGEEWLARPAGLGATGSGRLGSGTIAAVHFFRAAEPARPVREALLASGRLWGLYDEELRALWIRATAIVVPESKGSGGG